MLDTNVVSVLTPLARRKTNPALVSWLDQNSARLLLPSVAVAELSGGIAKLRRLGRVLDAHALDGWMATILHLYARSILPMDTEAAHATGLLLDLGVGKGLKPDFADMAIAGIARSRGLTLLTRNTGHFDPLGIDIHDPFEALPE